MVSLLDEQKMAFTRLYKRKLLTIALLYSVIAPASAAIVMEYASPMGDEKWRMTGSRLRCGLSLTVPNYGIAYIEQYAARPAHFLMSNWQQVDKPLAAVVYASPPIWKPGGAVFEVAKTTVSPGEFAIYLPREPTIKLLNYLSKGFQTKFHYISEQGFPTSVALSPIRFQSVYAKYKRCLGNLLPFDFSTVRLTILLFNSDSAELSDAAKQQLQKIAEYSRADANLKKIHIAGYTDDIGRKSYNNAVSEDRAKAVGDYLSGLGVPESRLSITWYGLKNPVASNATEEGKAANRRVVIKLLR